MRVVKLAKRPATYEDLLKVPNNLVAEIIEGELYTSPRPAPAHLLAASSLGARIHTHFHDGGGGPGGWWILNEPELHLGPDILVPDIAGWRRARMPALPTTPAFELAPDWICEVLSPSTSRIDRMLKLPMYGRADVAFAWLVDPIQRTLEAFRLTNGQWSLLGIYGDAVARIEPFEEIEFPVASLWISDEQPA